MQADFQHFLDVVSATRPKDLAGGAGEVAGDIPFMRRSKFDVRSVVDSVGQAFRSEFEAVFDRKNVDGTLRGCEFIGDMQALPGKPFVVPSLGGSVTVRFHH